MPRSILRHAAILAATAFAAFVPSSGGGIGTTAAIGIAAATFASITSEAEARPRVQDHRRTIHHSPPRRPPSHHRAPRR